jgi:hypothetical protein
MTPMEALNNHIDSKELGKLQINSPILSYQFRCVTVEINRKTIRKFDEKALYQVEFRPNFFSNAMAQRALTRIDKVGYANFMTTFDKKSLPIKADFNFPSFEIVEWLNQNVGKNLPQSQAVKHIVSRSSFPSPYIVFGPPGMR